ncbi:MAG: AprI/Inh family metalloprotease inhibitor [Beijerinckiaceae bacterium]|jgi:hypothetical protein|nr:AprI/Inh family metalloprotease inhibitor [Beijerinckiaceae bacterium]
MELIHRIASAGQGFRPAAGLVRASGRSAILALSLGVLLGACAGADRFGSGGPFATRGAAASAPQLPSAPPIATSPVESQALPPPGGAPVPGDAQIAGGTAGALPPPADPFFQPSTPPPAPRTIETPTLQGGSGQIATLGGGSATSTGRGPVSSRDGVIGGWTAREATGGSCRVQLSSSPALDLYRASAAGCANRDLQKITAWDYRDGEVYLYQPGGSVAARMRVNSGSSLAGVIARSGASLSMSR